PWEKSDARVPRRRVRTAGALDPVAWHDVEPRLRDRLQTAGSADPSSGRFMVSAHGPTADLFVLKALVEGLLGAEGLASTTVTWTGTEKKQPAGVKFVVPTAD